MTLSIIIPSYNSAEFIESCLESVRAFDDKSLEVVVIDDGSTDQSKSIIESFVFEKARLRIISQPNAGVSAARNAGLDACTGDYVAFVDADDRIEATVIPSLSEALDQTHPDLLVLNSLGDKGLKYSFPDGIDESANYSAAEVSAMDYARGSVCGVLFKRQFLQDKGIRFIPGFTHGEDSLFMAECLSKLDAIRFLSIDFYLVTEHPSSASHNFTAARLAAEKKALDHIRKAIDGSEKDSVSYMNYNRLLYSLVINDIYAASKIKGLRYREFKSLVKPSEFLPIDASCFSSRKKKTVASAINHFYPLYCLYIRLTR